MTRLPFAAIWVLGWAALVFGIVALNVVIIVGGAVAVAGAALGFATNNYATWFGLAALGDAVALIAAAVSAWGTGAAVAAAAMAAVGVGLLAWAVTVLLTPYRP